MKTLRTIFILAILVMPAFGLQTIAQTTNGGGSPSKNNVLDEVVWIVGDEPILRSDVEMLRLSAEVAGQRLEGDPYVVYPEQIAVRKLFLHQAELDSIEVTENDVKDYVDNYMERMVAYAGSQKNLETIRNQSFQEIRSDVAKQCIEERKIEMVKHNIVGDTKPTPAEVRRYLKTFPTDSLPVIPTQVEVQIITESPVVPQEEINRVKTELMEYADRINKGGSFAMLARMYSQDGSAANGGELGFMGRAELVPEFSAVAFALTDPKTVSKIVKTEYGYHIIQLIERKGDKVNCRHILRRPELSEDEIQKTLNRLDSVAVLVKDGKIEFDKAVLMFSEDKDTRNNEGLMINADMESFTQSSRFTMNELHGKYQEIGKVVERMSVGEISKSFRMQGKSGMEVCSIVRLKSRIPEHKADITADFQLLSDMVSEKHAAKLVEDWLQEKVKTTYVSIKDSWKKNNFKYNWLKN